MKKIIILISVALFGNFAKAQTETDPYGSEINFDTTQYDESTYSEPEVPKTSPKFKPYERFKSPIDTVSNLITYMGVVAFKPFINDVYDGGTIDSLYLRSKKFLMRQFLAGYKETPKKPMVFPKEMLVEDYRPDGDVGRIIIRVTAPLMVKNNSFSSTQNGTVSFKIDLRVKEDKYKYKFTNFVHNTLEKGSEKPTKVYMEYYANQAKGLKYNDRYLVAIDRMVKEIIKDLGKVIKDPIVLDEDDF